MIRLSCVRLLRLQVEMLLSSDSSVGVAKSIGLGTIGFADALDRLRPDLLVRIPSESTLRSSRALPFACRSFPLTATRLCARRTRRWSLGYQWHTSLAAM